jgi:ATP-binding cassette, subfamily A (ABC1), member 3
VLSDVGAEISFQLPSNASASFKALLMDIDAHTDDLCVSSYGMSVTTLEEVRTEQQYNYINLRNGVHWCYC